MEAENDQFTVQGISQMLWSWSTLGLKIPKAVVYALVQALMRQWDKVHVQALTTSIWALANMGFMDEKSVFEAFRKKFATLKVEQFVIDKDSKKSKSVFDDIRKWAKEEGEGHEHADNRKPCEREQVKGF